MSKNITVTMTVDTSTLSPGVSQSVIDAACTLTDDNGDSSGHENFTINADQGDTVTFLIVAQDGTTAVSYDSFIYHDGNSGVFAPLPSSPNWVGTVETGSTDVSETFYIKFYAAGNLYELDPEISVNP